MDSQENADAYSKMAAIVQGAFEQLLVPLERTRSPAQLLESTTAESFFQDFLIHADSFAEKSSQEFAKALRQFSLVPEVRGTPTAELAKQIRAICFDKLDRILASYVASLRDLNLDLSITSNQIAGSSVVDAALHGAAVGQLAGGLGRAGKNLGTFSAIWKGADELLKQGALVEQQLELLKRARRLPYDKICDFLNTSAGLPEELLDYGCAKCFGGQVDFVQQQKALELVSLKTGSKLKEAVTMVQAIPAAEAEVTLKKAAVAAAKVKLDNSQGCAGCLGVIAFIALLAGFMVFADQKSATDPEPLIVCVVVAIGFGIAAVAVLWRGRRTPVTTPNPDHAKTKTFGWKGPFD
jgi:hypothetical protein